MNVASAADYASIRSVMASWPADASSDVIGQAAPTLENLFAPEHHSAALDPNIPIVVGSRGSGKSVWAGVLNDPTLRDAARTAYPHLGLERIKTALGYTGISGPYGVDRDRLDQCVPESASPAQARAFFWATILRGLPVEGCQDAKRLPDLLPVAADPEQREKMLSTADESLKQKGEALVIIYDALDTMAVSWPRQRLLTQALLEVVWAMRAYRTIRVKLFLRPDQIEDDQLRFVELPKLRASAVRLKWSGADLYGMLFARLALGSTQAAFGRLLSALNLPQPSPDQILTRKWALTHDKESQEQLMANIAGTYMTDDGPNAYKKGKTYDWPLNHLADARQEVTPRSFLCLLIAAAKYQAAPPSRIITPAGIHHGLREASKVRVEQLHQELPWIKTVLAPLAGLLMPQEEKQVFAVWRAAQTLSEARKNADTHGYLPPVPPELDDEASERALYLALEKNAVMFRRPDDRIDMPDLFRVAARLLKKGGTAPK